MLKSVLSPIPSHAMTCFKLPGNLCKRIQSTLTRFWWDANDGKKKICWIAWTKLTKSKRDGGLGIHDVEAFNDALLAKLGWRIITKPDSLMARVLCGKYCNSSRFLEMTPNCAASHGWRSVLRGRDLLLPNLSMAVGNGQATRVWADPWLSYDQPLKLMGPPNKNDQNMLVSELIDQQTKEWNREAVQRLLPHEAEKILSIKPGKGCSPDKIIWTLTKSGIYTTKTGYHAAETQATEMQTPTGGQNLFDWNNTIWKAACSPKIQIFLWKILQGALPLGENLEKRGMRENTACVHCGDKETAHHLFVSCSFARKLWELAPISTHAIPSTNISFAD